MRQVTTGQGGCCTPFPFTAAIWLLEEQEELRGGIQPSSRASRVWTSRYENWKYYQRTITAPTQVQKNLMVPQQGIAFQLPTLLADILQMEPR